MLRKLTILAIISIVSVLPVVAFAQAPEVEWGVSLGDSLTGDYGRGAFQTDDGNYIVGGNTNTWNGSYMDNILFELDESGDTLWSHTYGTSANQEIASCFRVLSDGSYMFCGRTNVESGGSVGYLYSINSDGSFNWSTAFGDPSIGESPSGFAPIGTNSFVAVTGFWYDGEYGYDMKVHFLGPEGAPVWDEHYYTTVADRPSCIQVTSDNGYIVTGSSQELVTYNIQLLLFKVSPLGAIEQWLLFGGPKDECGYWIIQTSDGGFLATGYRKREDNYVKDVYIVKFTSDYSVEWSKVYGFNYMDEGRYCLQTSDGGYVVGATTSAYDSFDFWLLRLDANGDTLWTKIVEKPDTDESLYSVGICDDGGYILCGNSTRPGEDTDIYVAKLGPETGIADSPQALPKRVRLNENYPNPFNAQTVISFDLPFRQDIALDIFDVLGKRVTRLIEGELAAGEHQVIFDSSPLSSGIYFYSLKTADQVETRRMTLIK